MRGLLTSGWRESLARKTKKFLAQSSLLSIGRREPARFIVLTRSRTGSNHFAAMLNSHPQILMADEIFSLLNGRSALGVYTVWRAPKAFFIKASGFKIFYYHPSDAAAPELWKKLIDDKMLRVIHLKRRNRLETELSREVASLTGKWLQKEGGAEAQVPQVVFDPINLERAFEKTQNEEAEFSSLFRDHPVLDLSYEEIVLDAQKQFDTACEFLSVPPRPARSNLTKQIKQDPAEIIANFAELHRYFAATQWAPFFQARNFTQAMIKLGGSGDYLPLQAVDVKNTES